MARFMLLKQLHSNKNICSNKAKLLFIIKTPFSSNAEPCFRLYLQNTSNADPYFKPCSQNNSIKPFCVKLSHGTSGESQYKLLETLSLATTQQKKWYINDNLINYLNRVTGICRLEILPLIINNILAIANEEGHSGFSRYFKIVARSWYIRDLLKLLCFSISHCP